MSIAYLPSRAVLQISGEDKEDFLQGLITNDIGLLETQKAIYACLLTPQGKYLYDFFIVNDGEAFFLDCEADRAEGLVKKLKLHRLRSKVEIKDTNWKVYVFWGEGGAPEGSYQDPRLQDLGHRLIRQGTLSSDQDESNYIEHCHRQGVPYHSQDLIPQKSILLESNMDELHAISWNKGCYLGQELTARTKHRGLVRKRLLPVTFEGVTPEFGSSILQNEVNVGEMRSAQNKLGIALLRLEALENKNVPFLVDRCEIKPYVPDWMDL